MITVRELLARVGEWKRSGADFYSNCYLFPTELDSEMNKQGAQLFESENMAALLVPENDFARLYFWGCGAEAPLQLGEVLKGVDTPVVADIVEAADRIELVAEDWFVTAGFELFSVLKRMKRIGLPATQDYPEVRWAEDEDAQELLDLLYTTFHTYTSRLSDMDWLRKRISNRDVLLIRREGIVAGMAMFECRKKDIYVEQLAVSRELRGQSLGGTLLSSVIARCCSERDKDVTFSLWAATGKESVAQSAKDRGPTTVLFYNKFGFQLDGVEDYIMLNRRGEKRNAGNIQNS